VICLTHDIDRVSRQSTPRQIMRIAHASFAGAGGDSRLNSGTARVARVLREVGAAVSRGVTPVPATSETLEPCIAIEQRKGVTASYFFAVYPPTRLSPIDCVYDPGDRCLHQGKRVRIRDVVRLLVDAGFDVGLHGSYHTATHGSELEAQKARLEEVAGANVTTTRQHWLHWDVRLTPMLHERAGLLSDSTLGFNRNVGFRAGTSMPFFHFDLQAGRRLDLVQVPIAVHDVPLIEVNGLELDHGLARDVTRQLLDSVAAVNGVATVLFHPDHLGKRDFRSLLEWTIDYGLDRGAWVTSVREIDRWWRARAKRILGPGADIEHGSSRVRN
jgi:peptidoglycan/xylan/chitin deacetylase (PgdA/CDA1 family)